ncbi:MAG: phosphoethanolamine transferase CptA [Zoogloeaceae bacterium]|nr:phosphoethanolamine transferase CptA [Zoogloeaceae bacterium]
MFSIFGQKSGASEPARQDTSRTDYAGIGWLYLFFWYFSGVNQTLLLTHAGFTGFREVFFLSFMWLAPVLLFPRLTKQIAAVIGIVLWAASLVNLGYLGIYGQEFSKSVIFTLFETNLEESSEYLSQYANPTLLLGLAVYTVIAVLLWRRLRPVYLPRRWAVIAAIFLIIPNLGYPYLRWLTGRADFDICTIRLQARLEPASPWQLVMGYVYYRRQIGTINDLLRDNASLPPLANLVDTSGEAPRTLVLVISESTTSRRMSLYGYPRQTTPRLDELKARGELDVFADVITTRPYTIEILQQVFTFADQLSPERALTEPNLMNLMRQAGYKSFWITNQQTMTARNTLLTMFAQQADEARYLNNQRSQNARQYDEVVFEPFADALQDTAPKKFIVVHLLGTHTKYDRRYPETYERFNDREQMPPSLDDEQAKQYNSYDNAVLYNDFVVSSLIERFAAHKDNGFLLYISDHGEEVFDTPPHRTIGRNEGAPTFNMYAIPFLLWTSPEWKRAHPLDLSLAVARKYSNADFIHTWSDLAGLSYDRFRPEKSLVNPAFQPTTRWIGNPENKKDLRDFDAVVPVPPGSPQAKPRGDS